MHYNEDWYEKRGVASMNFDRRLILQTIAICVVVFLSREFDAQSISKPGFKFTVMEAMLNRTNGGCFRSLLVGATPTADSICR
jgi:hypothetical protein